MTREEILNKIKTLVGAQLGCDEDSVTEESNFFEDLGADSLDHVELIMAVEEEFGISIPDEEAEQIKTVSQAIDYIFNEFS